LICTNLPTFRAAPPTTGGLDFDAKPKTGGWGATGVRASTLLNSSAGLPALSRNVSLIV